MKRKYKVLLKCAIYALITGVITAAAVYGLCTLYYYFFSLNEESTAKMIRILFTVLIGVTAMLASMSVQLGKIEKREERKWREEDRAVYTSNIMDVNLAGLIDDTQKKEFCTIYGERMKVGDDHGTAYMIFKTLFLLMLFVTVFTSLPMVLMLAVMR